MDKRDFAKWVSALQTYFPRYNLLPNAEAITLWYAELGDIPYHLLSAALRKWVNTEKFPPTISELRALCAEIVNGKPQDWGEAWQEVTQAIKRYGVYREEEAIASLSPHARTAAERIGWTAICVSENPEALRAQFRQVFEVCVKREAENRQLPESLREAITKIGGHTSPLLKERN